MCIAMANDEREAPDDSDFDSDYSLIDRENDDEDEFSYDSSYFSEEHSLFEDEWCNFSWPMDSEDSMELVCYQNGVQEMKLMARRDGAGKVIDIERERSPIEGAGKVIGDSLVLRKIDITIPFSANVGIDELFQGMSRNRSIELIQLRSSVVEPESDIFQALIPFFENNQNLRCIELYRARSWTLNSLASALSKCKNSSRLDRISIINPKVSDKSMAAFFDSLNNNAIHSVSELCLEMVTLGTMAGEALAKLLNNNSASYMNSLFVNLGNVEDDLCLGKALAVNTALKVLHIDVKYECISLECWHELSTFFSNPKSALETLTLEKIDNDDVFYLGEALAYNMTVTNLYIDNSFSNQTIGCDGWQGFSKCLRNPQSALRNLFITCHMDNHGIYEIVRAVKENSCLERLDISLNNSVVVERRVWRSLGRLLCDKRSIDHTFSSNHSLCRLSMGGCGSEEYDSDFVSIPHDTIVPRYIWNG